LLDTIASSRVRAHRTQRITCKKRLLSGILGANPFLYPFLGDEKRALIARFKLGLLFRSEYRKQLAHQRIEWLRIKRIRDAIPVIIEVGNVTGSITVEVRRFVGIKRERIGKVRNAIPVIV